jgi:hypothetical protein
VKLLIGRTTLLTAASFVLTLCVFAGTLPEWLGSLVYLEVLNLDSQAGTIPVLLYPAIISVCFVSASAGTLPEWLGSLKNLEVLNLGSQAGTTEATGLHGTIPAGIGQLSKLRELNLVRCIWIWTFTYRGTHMNTSF